MITQQLKHRDNSCPMYHTCSSLGYISEVCSIKCYLQTTQQEKKDKLLELYREKDKTKLELNALGYGWNKKKGTLYEQSKPYNAKIRSLGEQIKTLEEELK